MQTSALPLFMFDRIPASLADQSYAAWGHWLGACSRPFGRQDFGLWMNGELVGAATSASTVMSTCGGFLRSQVVELARLCAAPDHRDMTRVVLRLWRAVAAAAWEAAYWPVRALLSYQNAVRHTGNLYRFDGWRKVADVKGATVSNYGRARQKLDAKAIWVYPPEATP